MRLGDEDDAVHALMDGGLAVLPTETLWGLAARAGDADAVQALFRAKGRPEGVPLAVAFPTWAEATAALEVGAGAARLAARFLPGPLSVVLRRAPGNAAGDRYAHCAPRLETLSVRVPDHPLAHRVLTRTGPLALTSANRHGAADPATAADVLEALAGVDGVVAALDPDQRVPGTASTVVDATGPRPRVLREGVIPEAEVAAAWA